MFNKCICHVLLCPTTWPTPSNEQPSSRETKQTEGRSNKQLTKKANTSASESNISQWSTTDRYVEAQLRGRGTF